MTTNEYLYDTDESNRRRELHLSRVKEPPSPFFSHQAVVLRVAKIWSDHVEPRGLGRVATAPLDVILDRDRALILQPDVLFVSTPRLSIIRNQIWGAPDLVAEVLSPSTLYLDRGQRLDWYEQYGVRECWLVDLYENRVTVVDCTQKPRISRAAKGVESITSTVLPDLELTAFGLFA